MTRVSWHDPIHDRVFRAEPDGDGVLVSIKARNGRWVSRRFCTYDGHAIANRIRTAAQRSVGRHVDDLGGECEATGSGEGPAQENTMPGQKSETGARGKDRAKEVRDRNVARQDERGHGKPKGGAPGMPDKPPQPGTGDDTAEPSPGGDTPA